MACSPSKLASEPAGNGFKEFWANLSQPATAAGPETPLLRGDVGAQGRPGRERAVGVGEDEDAGFELGHGDSLDGVLVSGELGVVWCVVRFCFVV